MVGGCCNTIAMGAYDGEWLGNADQSSCAGGSNLYVPIGLGRTHADRTDELAIDSQWQPAGHFHKARARSLPPGSDLVRVNCAEWSAWMV